jgi:hypothetical protein
MRETHPEVRISVMKYVALHPDWKGGGKDEDETAQAILKYLKAQPQAGDTLEGIAKWWLVRQRASESTEVVRESWSD